MNGFYEQRYRRGSFKGDMKGHLDNHGARAFIGKCVPVFCPTAPSQNHIADVLQ